MVQKSFLPIQSMLHLLLLMSTVANNSPEASPWAKEHISYDRYVTSVDLFNQAVQLNSPKPSEAKQLYLESVKVNPYLAEAWLNLGMLGTDSHEIEQFYKKAAEVASEGRNNLVYADAMGNLGHHIVEDSGRGHDYHVVEEAIKYYEAGLRVVPDHLSILYNVGIAYERQGKRQEAYDSYQKALKIDRFHIGANLNSGNLCMYAGLHNISLGFHQRALEAYATNGHNSWWQIGLLNNMGQTMLMMFEPEKAMELYRQALAIDSNDAMTLFNMFKINRQMCSWDGWSEIHVPQMISRTIKDLNNGPNTTMMPYDITLMPVSKKLILKVAKSNLYKMEGLHPPIRHPIDIENDQFIGIGQGKDNKRKDNKRKDNGKNNGKDKDKDERGMALNVGYYGYDFNNHPMGHLTLGLFELHDRQRVNVMCAPYGSDDDSLQRDLIIQACDTFVNTSNQSDHGVASTITTQLNAHIAVDLMAHTTGTRVGITAYHPGVILVNYLGYPGTMGYFSDFIMVDKLTVRFNIEKLKM